MKDQAKRDFICHAINTCEYCADTIPQLETLIQGKIDPAYKEHINFDDEVKQIYCV